MTDREKILIALREKPLKVFEIMKRVNIKHEDDCQSLLLKMRDEGAVKFETKKNERTYVNVVPMTQAAAE